MQGAYLSDLRVVLPDATNCLAQGQFDAEHGSGEYMCFAGAGRIVEQGGWSLSGRVQRATFVQIGQRRRLPGGCDFLRQPIAKQPRRCAESDDTNYRERPQFRRELTKTCAFEIHAMGYVYRVSKGINES